MGTAVQVLRGNRQSPPPVIFTEEERTLLNGNLRLFKPQEKVSAFHADGSELPAQRISCTLQRSAALCRHPQAVQFSHRSARFTSSSCIGTRIAGACVPPFSKVQDQAGSCRSRNVGTPAPGAIPGQPRLARAQ